MTELTMQMKERSEAIGRAQRALKALGDEHPRPSKKELGHAREHLIACYAVAQVEAMAERRYGLPGTEEQRQLVEATEDPEEPATAARSRAVEDRAIPSTSSTTVDMQRISSKRKLLNIYSSGRHSGPALVGYVSREIALLEHAQMAPNAAVVGHRDQDGRAGRVRAAS
jgi:hypothetical protein